MWATWVGAAMRPEAAAAAWAVTYVTASKVMPQTWGTAMTGGMERWRCAWAVPTQLFILPLLYALGAGTCFSIIFTLFMGMDFVIAGRVEDLIPLHHIVCLMGNAAVMIHMPDGFDTYFAGVVALEFGSGVFNVWSLTPTARWRAVLFAIGMTASNAAACALAYQWAQLPLMRVPKALCLITTLGLVFMRQRACIESLWPGAEVQETPATSPPSSLPPSPTCPRDVPVTPATRQLVLEPALGLVRRVALRGK